MNYKINRVQVLIASTIVLLCTGAVYAFSVFAGPLSAVRGWSMGEIMMAFTINAAISPVPMILGGFLTDRGLAKWTITIGGLMFGAGFFLTGMATTPTMLYLTYGIIGGLGQGLAYSGCLSNTIKLFPDKKGLASGIITAGMGGAAIIAAPVGNYLVEHYDVLQAFKTLGIAYFVIILVASFFIKNTPDDYQPAGWTPPATKGNGGAVNKNWVEMLKTPYFYLIFLMFFTGAFSGLMIASNASVIGQQMFKLSAGTAAFYVSLYSLSNCAGRVVWGTVSDKIGRNRTLTIILIAVMVAFGILVSLSSQVGFALGIIILGLCFGGVMGVFPPMVIENYGPVNQGVNYGIIFTGYSVAAFFAPRVAASMAASDNGDFTKAFYVAIVVAFIGLILNLIYMRLRKSETAK
ncbi:OFA family oxalate/formate antiporter-like MFS transporter [Enterococcus sp. PF1-24]|uniref:L-lactate MFS transporter n=1 Tax=unclassified Enterococcus TaxID=2608891 RepID=UPI002476BE79|nr:MULTISPECIES: OFA family MFS transporter [unclassified Enterococcus]MDH6363891.1 OFA family oxalate/formate antiporter-like MFS transporter [Enterococcus sp. PFB1-1]MDH6400923.1 OFA family oxalate/formate antiporter-like MFS transporter [Enterococcus sp. PF1-24]